MDFFQILLLIGSLLVAANTDQQANGASQHSESPYDRVTPSTVSRVKKLVEHFELIEKSSRDVELAQSTNVVLSLGESATKLYKLIHGSTQDVKCSRYVKLISFPDIRTVATISALVREGSAINELVQTDANLIAKLAGERQFDSMSRIQSIIQTLESERTLGKSSFEPDVEKDLLDCVNYYVYRHQNVLNSVVEHVRHSMDNLSKHLFQPSESKIFLEKIDSLIGKIVDIEQDGDRGQVFNQAAWLESLAELQDLVMQNNFEMPQQARDFLADSDRVNRLNFWLESVKLKNKILELEPNLSWFNKQSDANRAYRMALSELIKLCSRFHFRFGPSSEECKILLDPRRANIVKELDKENIKHDEKETESSSSSVRMEPLNTYGMDKIRPDNFGRVATSNDKKDVTPNTRDDSQLPSIESLFDNAWSLPAGEEHRLGSRISDKVHTTDNEGNSSNSREKNKEKKWWFW